MRVTMPAPDAANSRIGEAVALSATLQPPPEPIEPGGFDFGRQAWFASLGATGYATPYVKRGSTSTVATLCDQATVTPKTASMQ